MLQAQMGISFIHFISVLRVEECRIRYPQVVRGTLDLRGKNADDILSCVLVHRMKRDDNVIGPFSYSVQG